MGGISAGDLDVERIGDGPPVVLVHGSIVGPVQTWRAQRELAARWTLILPHRPGFGGSPPLPRGDFEAEAPLIAELLGDGAHLVGHSYGAVIALHAAALRPHAVRSLTVTEPGSLRIAAGDEQVATVVDWGEELYRRRDELGPHEFVQLFRTGVGSAHATPEAMPEWLVRGAAHVMQERPPWESDPPLDALAAAAFPKLVISGRHSPVFETVCDVLAERIGAERATASGRGHSIPLVGERYNALLEGFLTRAERCARAGGAGR
ncbi:MAG TPA: alpha/beta fold hydrolase [Conexibacter sp.]